MQMITQQNPRCRILKGGGAGRTVQGRTLGSKGILTVRHNGRTKDYPMVAVGVKSECCTMLGQGQYDVRMIGSRGRRVGVLQGSYSQYVVRMVMFGRLEGREGKVSCCANDVGCGVR